MKAPTPVVAIGIGVTVAIVNLLTISIPAGANPAAFLIGYLATPIVLALLYTAWYVRRDRTGRPQ
jgi:hypothetical protein